MSTLLESILRNVKITNEILGTAATPPDATNTVKGISTIFTSSRQLTSAIDDGDPDLLKPAVSGTAIAPTINQVTQIVDTDLPAIVDRVVELETVNQNYSSFLFYINGSGKYSDLSQAYNAVPTNARATIYTYNDGNILVNNTTVIKECTIVGTGRTQLDFNNYHFITTTNNAILKIKGFVINETAYIALLSHNYINLIFEDCEITFQGINITASYCSVTFKNCKITGTALYQDGFWDIEAALPTADRLISSTAGTNLKVIIDNCDIQLHTLGSVGTGGEMYVYNSRITCAYLFDHANSHNAYYKFYNSKILCKSEKLAWSSIGYTGAFITNTINVIISGCEVYAGSIRYFGADDNTLSSYFYSSSATSKLQVLNSTFRLSTPDGVGSYNLVKAYTGATIGKVGFVGCVTSTDKDAGVTLSFGTLTVSADLI